MMYFVGGPVSANGGTWDRDIKLGECCSVDSVQLKKDTKIFTSWSQFYYIIESMRKKDRKVYKNLEDINTKLGKVEYEYRWARNIEPKKNKKKDVEILFSDLYGIDFALFQYLSNGEVLLTHT